MKCLKSVFLQPRYPTGLRDKTLIMSLWRLGLRIDEALELRIKDIDFENASVRILRGKGHKVRTVGLDIILAEQLRQWIARRRELSVKKNDPLFCTLKGNKLSDNDVRDMLKRRASKAGIDKRIHPHGFRHTFAVELVRENTNVKYIQQTLGHASLATTDEYLQGLCPNDAINVIRNRV